MKIKPVLRNRDVVYGNKDLKTIYTFKKFPVFMGVSKNHYKTDKFFRMRWQISKRSGMLQLNPLLPLNILYPETHNSGCVGKLWEKHHSEFAKFVRKHKPKKVLEIGACHGILFEKFIKLQKKVNWTIIEPNPQIKKSLKVKIIKSFFDKNSKIAYDTDVFVHSHVIEHIYNLHDFIENLNKKIALNKHMVFSVPNLEIMLQRKYTNCINFEHTIFLTQPFIKYFLELYNFKIIKKKFFQKDHSIFYSCKKIIQKNKPKKIKSYYDKNKKIFKDYISHHLTLIKRLNKKILLTKRPVFLFGAHVFSQYLLSFGLDPKKIIYVLDNDNHKQNKRLYGTKLQVRSPKVLSSYKKPIVILKAGIYKNEIKNDILKNINPNTSFI